MRQKKTKSRRKAGVTFAPGMRCSDHPVDVCLRSLCFLCADQHDSAKLDPLGVASELIPSSSHLPPIQPKSALSDRTDFADESSIGVLPLSTSSRRKKGLKDHLKNLDDDASSSTRPRRYICRAFSLFTRCFFL